MQMFEATRDKDLDGPMLLVLASVAADMGLQASALAYIDRAYAAFSAPIPLAFSESDVCTLPAANAGRSGSIRLITMNGEVVQS
jgi:hypothetical protein